MRGCPATFPLLDSASRRFGGAPVEASWRSGYAEDCKSLHPGSIPGEASIPLSTERRAWIRHTDPGRPLAFSLRFHQNPGTPRFEWLDEADR